ncbi:Bug family tripartite tricarboxylate transporter substrate binding protein [Noviherbaspirillum malthae]|jgi:tripartite-type tricarboxylate transporter receptor subunit TctC|uniref:Bug family tripartite tricarboxylate transporter substrate binding protein n=1 Tax=Noviherbaspirillum malthae TaxID=1260987 RepID=UPI00188FEA46|nr:tripartite tricarboxylate transporter substrate binding protein [Noviherbaspirillum malthae]
MKTLPRLLLAATLGACVMSASAEQPYPNKPIRLIVPFPPGGGTDIVARLVGNKLQENLKWTVIVDNRPGAGGNIGVDLAAKSPADGYTVVMGQTSNLAVNPTLYTKLPYNPLKDFVPVTTVATAPLVLVVAANSPYKTLADVVSAAKAKPGDLTFASPGNGTVAHLTGELLQKAAGIKLQHVPYKGSTQAITDLMGGSVQLYMSSVPSAMSQIKSGKLRPLAVTSDKRSDDLPQVPTINESGYKGFNAITWFGLLVPAGTPAPIVARLNTEVNKALQSKDVQQKIGAEGGDAHGSTPEEFASLLKTDIVKWGQIVKESGAKID